MVERASSYALCASAASCDAYFAFGPFEGQMIA
jgi:hypothetical protein